MRIHLRIWRGLWSIAHSTKARYPWQVTIYHTDPLEPDGAYTECPEIQLLLRSAVLFGHLQSATTQGALDTTPQEKVVECQIWWLQRPSDGASPSCPLPRTCHLASETTKLRHQGPVLIEIFRSTLYVRTGQMANLDALKQLIIAAATTETPEMDYNCLSSRYLSSHQRNATGLTQM